MKKAGFLPPFILLMSFYIILPAQNGWFDNNPQWVNSLNSSWRGAGVEYISVQGDTVVDGYPAKILRRFEDMETSPDQTLVRVARQSGDTIWCLNHPAPNINYFYIHYNFSLGVGDSIAFPPYYGGGTLRIKYIITATGTLDVDGLLLRYQDVDLYYNNAYRCDARIIEKIGMVNTGCNYNGLDPRLWQWEHFFVDEPNELFVDGQRWFFCQYRNDLMDFELTDNTCSDITNVPVVVNPETRYSIAPNPFADNFRVLPSPKSMHLLRIYNSAGQVVLETEQPSRVVNTERLLHGMYHIEMLSKSGEQHFIRAVKQ